MSNASATLIPLSDLHLSTHNARRTGGKDVEGLAANIAALGLLQNLIVEPSPKSMGGFGVIAGGRRLAALKLLAQQDRLPPELADGIPCLIETDTSRVLEASTAENTVRERMHPHDEFVAFRDLAAEGMGVDTIAARFGVSPLVVERRLRLANLSPVLLRLFREDKATLEQLMALAITDDHAAQERAWGPDGRQPWAREPRRLREALTEKHVHSSDRRVVFVGLAAYEAAGGAVVRDLFEPGAGYVADIDLLDRLGTEKLEAAAEALRAEGWSWVKLLDYDDHSFVYKFNRSQPRRSELSDDAKAELQQLEARAMQLDDELTQAEEAEEAGDFDFEAAYDERELITARIKELSATAEVWSDRQKAKAGACVKLGHSGTLEITRGLIAETPQAARQAAAATQTEDGTPAPKPAPTLAESMLRRLSAHRTVALQAELLKRADVALATLAYTLLVPLIYPPQFGGDLPIQVKAESATRELHKLGFADLDANPDLTQTAQALEDMRYTLHVPGTRAGLLPWLLEQTRDTVVGLLASVPVMTLDAVMRGGGTSFGAVAIADALDLNMADHWQPTAETFFSLVPAALAIEAVAEVCGKTVAAQLTGLKKAELAGKAEELTRRSGWLPKPLRRPGYALRKNAPKLKAKPAAAKTAAKKAAAKKPAK
jgi:ParB family chromosome partitioning protein